MIQAKNKPAVPQKARTQFQSEAISVCKVGGETVSRILASGTVEPV